MNLLSIYAYDPGTGIKKQEHPRRATSAAA